MLYRGAPATRDLAHLGDLLAPARPLRRSEHPAIRIDPGPTVHCIHVGRDCREGTRHAVGVQLDYHHRSGEFVANDSAPVSDTRTNANLGRPAIVVDGEERAAALHV